MMTLNSIPPCTVCGATFDNVFEATDHLLEDNDEKFDPVLILPNGYRLLIGSLMRCIFDYANDPEQVKSIAQSTYATLYAAEHNPGEMKSLIEEIIINEHLSKLDEELKELLTNEQPNENGE